MGVKAPKKPKLVKPELKQVDKSGSAVCPECETKLRLNKNGSIPAHSRRDKAGMLPCSGGIPGLYFLRLYSKQNTKGEHE